MAWPVGFKMLLAAKSEGFLSYDTERTEHILHMESKL